MFRKSNHRTCLVTFIFVLFFSYNSFSQGVAAPFLTLCPSAEGVGMGNSGVAIVFDDAYGQWFNPAQLGITSQKNNITLSYTAPVKWIFYDTISYNTFGLSAGYNFSKEFGIPFSIGAGYIRQFMNLGEFMRTDENGQVLGKFKSSEYADAFTVAAGLDYWVKIGFGLTYKHVSSNLLSINQQQEIEGIANAMDIGLILSAPVLRDLKILDKTTVNANINAGYSLSNIFDNMNYPGEVDPLPRTARLGYSIGANIHHNYKGIDFELIALDWSAQATDLLVKRDTVGFDYEPIMGNINVLNNVILLKSENGVSANYGFRISLAETFKYMRGWMTLNTQGDYTTKGYEISTCGLLKFLAVMTANQTLNYISTHFELAYVHADYTWINPENSTLNFNRIYDGLNLKFRNFIL